MMSVEQSVEWELAGETEVLGENLPHCTFVDHKCHMTWPGHRSRKPGTNRLALSVCNAAASFPSLGKESGFMRL
jgi:hypothetical protein